MPVPTPVAAPPPWRLVSAERLRMAMERTGTGRSITTRELAAAAGISTGAISNLCTGRRRTVPYDVAPRIADALGVDVPFLFELTGRAVPVPADEILVDDCEAVPA